MICYFLEKQITGKRAGKKGIYHHPIPYELRKVANELNFF